MATQIPRQLLLVDEDAALRGLLGEQLGTHDGFQITEAARVAEALALLEARSFDALLLSTGLGGNDQADVCRQLRRQGFKAPILLLVRRGESPAPHLEAGANDYVEKPFKLSQLLARLRAQLRAYDNSENAELVIGRFLFRPTDKLLQHRESGEQMRLTEKESQILRYLYRAGERAVSRETLLGEVWGYNAAVTTHTLETHIYRLRQKMEENPSAATLLLTEGGGYRLIP
ncbi:response regulator transcription factor [Aquibaculum arenosum]|uniref:Response regulator transcription factor n=1 Tax=Aquibaculum arenosum TaxID=3032591 RepID=A0ABT5YN27_9PROT|nr:response regulator transcription factor [Fodinicurvata sp. CAU 1616]MDF2095664.1 response regulator transcription factor [Fodinicurvata sp. CAU 1616]